jgi:hypothetical protein
VGVGKRYFHEILMVVNINIGMLTFHNTFFIKTESKNNEMHTMKTKASWNGGLK